MPSNRRKKNGILSTNKEPFICLCVFYVILLYQKTTKKHLHHGLSHQSNRVFAILWIWNIKPFSAWSISVHGWLCSSPNPLNWCWQVSGLCLFRDKSGSRTRKVNFTDYFHNCSVIGALHNTLWRIVGYMSTQKIPLLHKEWTNPPISIINGAAVVAHWLLELTESFYS